MDKLSKILHSRIFTVFVCLFICFSLLLGAFVAVTNAVMVFSARDRILSLTDAASLDGVECILVLGCLVRSDGSPSDMLYDRLSVGVDLYFSGVSPKLLMSGDHGQVEYDEVNAMRDFAIGRGALPSDVFMDHAGFSTYESVYRAKEIFGAQKIVIVTQGYHLTRALYIAKSLGIEAYGVSADLRSYRGQIIRDVREIVARSKDFLYTVIRPEPTYLGESISLAGDAEATLG